MKHKRVTWHGSSPKNVSAHPERLASFKGSLLIGPKEALAHELPLVACDKPKLAFIRVTDKFFRELSDIV